MLAGLLSLCSTARARRQTPLARLFPAYARPCSARKRIRLPHYGDTSCQDVGCSLPSRPVAPALPARGPPTNKDLKRAIHRHRTTVLAIVAPAQAQAQAQGRIYGAEARRASIDGQITRQGPVGREGRQCCSHSGPLCWRPQKAARGSPHGQSHHGQHGQPAIQPNRSPWILVISDKIASRPSLGQQSRAGAIRSEAMSGHRNHRHRATLGREKGEPRSE